MNKIKKGKLNFDQSGRAYPDNPEIDENWDCIWENDGKYYRLVGLPYHAEWSELKSHKFELTPETPGSWFHRFVFMRLLGFLSCRKVACGT